MGSRLLHWSRRVSRSLFAQMVLVTVLALLVLTLLTLASFRTTLSFRAIPSIFDDLAEPVAEVVYLTEGASPEAEKLILDVFSGPTRVAFLDEGFSPSAEPRSAFRQRLMRNSPEANEVLRDRDIRFRYVSPNLSWRESTAGLRHTLIGVTALEIAVSLEDGRVLVTRFSPGSVFVERPRTAAALLILSSILIGSTAAGFIRLALRPLKELETAAVRFGATIDPEPVDEKGAEEIRRVARALNRTQDQVRSLIAERARMISALAHDIRTSLTRLRLRLDGPGATNPAALSADLEQMQSLIDDMLTYAKSGEPGAPKELIDLPLFLKAYAANAPVPLPLQMAGHEHGFTIAADPKALLRSLNNLVDNARTYGGGGALCCETTAAGLRIHVDDDGPGIPENQLGDVFEPFFRLETSRNRETGGSGLGLGIAKSLIEAQGGTLTLENRQPTGLRATIFFPEHGRVE